MYPYKELRRKLLFNTRKSEIGYIFFLPCIDDDIIRQCFNVNHFGHYNFFNFPIAFYKKEIIGNTDFLISGIQIALGLFNSFQEPCKGNWFEQIINHIQFKTFQCIFRVCSCKNNKWRFGKCFYKLYTGSLGICISRKIRSILCLLQQTGSLSRAFTLGNRV